MSTEQDVEAHEALQAYFDGALDELRGAYARSLAARNSTVVGTLRERGIRRALQGCLPSIARMVDGEIIATHHARSGQLDGIVVHASGAALGFDDEPRVVLAEGVLAAIEAKSDLRSQWEGIRSTWSRVLPLRRSFDPRIPAPANEHPSEPAIPFIAIGFRGWDTVETLVEEVQELHTMFMAGPAPTAIAPPILLVQLDLPAIAAVVDRVEGTPLNGFPQVVRSVCPEDRGRVLRQIWSQLTFLAQRLSPRPADFAGYLKIPKATDPAAPGGSV
jgi:hypothetical protein